MSETDAVRDRRAAMAFSPSRLMHDRDTDRSARIEQAWRLDDGSRVGCIVAGHAISLPADDPLVERFLAAGGSIADEPPTSGLGSITAIDTQPAGSE